MHHPPQEPARAWPPAEPVFDRDVPIDEGIFVRRQMLYSLAVRQVSEGRDADGWIVQVAVVGNTTSHLTLYIGTSLLTRYDRPQRAAQYVLDVVRDWVELPMATRPTFLDLR